MSSRLTFTPEQIQLINETDHRLRTWMDVEGLSQWIAKECPNYEIVLFGSRINGKYQNDSDLDVMFHNSHIQGEWMDEDYCQNAYEALIKFCETFKTYVSIPMRLDALLSHYRVKGEFMGIYNRPRQSIRYYEEATSGWDYGEIPYYFKLNAQGLSFEVVEGCEDEVFDGDAFKSCY